MSEATNIGHLEKSYLAAALLLGTVVVETRDPNLVNTLHKMLFKVVSQIESTDCQQKTKQCSSSTAMFSFGVAHPKNPFSDC